VPAENKYPVEEIIGMLRNATLKKKRRITFSYVMINGVNDTSDHLSELRKLFVDSGIRINLLPYHQLRNDEHISSPDDRMQYFKHQLVVSGVSASIRKSRGSDISAACGLLASEL
ncbi:MAG: 23S rRNA (adenine(2503)-C(2))-methyltransferase RlmN, partial [Chloroflexota bacterium]